MHSPDRIKCRIDAKRKKGTTVKKITRTAVGGCLSASQRVTWREQVATQGVSSDHEAGQIVLTRTKNNKKDVTVGSGCHTRWESQRIPPVPQCAGC